MTRAVSPSRSVKHQRAIPWRTCSVGWSARRAPIKARIRMTEDHIFVNLNPEAAGEWPWMLMGVSGMDQILLWAPDRELFRKLIAEGKIKGTNDPDTEINSAGEEVKKKNPGAVIDDPEGLCVKQMIEGQFGVIVNGRSPMVFRGVKEGTATDGSKSEEAVDGPEEEE